MLAAFLIAILVAAGLTFSFIGACRNEMPRVYSIIGFILNILWLVLPVAGIGIGLLALLLV